jgi:hypothetical protein
MYEYTDIGLDVKYFWPVQEGSGRGMEQGAEPRAAGPPANTGGRAAGQYELPLGRNGLLPLVADLCEELHDL